MPMACRNLLNFLKIGIASLWEEAAGDLIFKQRLGSSGKGGSASLHFVWEQVKLDEKWICSHKSVILYEVYPSVHLLLLNWCKGECTDIIAQFYYFCLIRNILSRISQHRVNAVMTNCMVKAFQVKASELSSVHTEARLSQHLCSWLDRHMVSHPIEQAGNLSSWAALSATRSQMFTKCY